MSPASSSSSWRPCLCWLLVRPGPWSMRGSPAALPFVFSTASWPCCSSRVSAGARARAARWRWPRCSASLRLSWPGSGGRAPAPVRISAGWFHSQMRGPTCIAVVSWPKARPSSTLAFCSRRPLFMTLLAGLLMVDGTEPAARQPHPADRHDLPFVVASRGAAAIRPLGERGVPPGAFLVLPALDRHAFERASRTGSGQPRFRPLVGGRRPPATVTFLSDVSRRRSL